MKKILGKEKIMDRTIIRLLTEMEDAVRHLQKNQKLQTETINSIVKTTKELQDDVNSVKGGL